MKIATIALGYCFKLDQRVSHLLVDEAQDTSPLQWRIVHALCHDFFSGEGAHTDRSLFVVGDEKQSIYSFQGADPILFSAYAKHFEAQTEHSGASWHNIVMDRSFRSSPAVLSLVDHIINQTSVHNSVSSYPDAISHNIHRKSHYSRITLAPFFTPDKPDKDTSSLWDITTSYNSTPSLHKLAANKLADEIHQWFSEEKIMPNHDRTIQAGDIMILVQKRGEFVTYLTKALSNKGLPISGADRLNLLDPIAIDDLLALAHFTTTPYDDLNLAALLKSPFCNLDEEQLYNLAIARHDQTLWHALQAQENFNQIIRFLNYSIELQNNTSIKLFFSTLLDTLGYRETYISIYGVELHDIFNEFLFLCERYEQQHIASMQHFLSWIKQQNITIKRDIANSDNVIRIMTVHGAKGLQSPIVILPDTYQERPSKVDSLLWHSDYEQPPLCLWTTHHGNTPFVQSLKTTIKQAEEDEKLRLLYVALTRAEDELYIMGYGNKHSETKPDWYNIIHTSMKELGQEHNNGDIVYEPLPVSHFPQMSNSIAPHTPKSYTPPPPCMPKTLRTLTRNDKSASSPDIEQGVFIHSMLELLPEHPLESRERFITSHVHQFSSNPTKQQQLISHLTHLLHSPDLDFLFNHQHSFSEITIYTPQGKRIIDRLIITETTVYIIDYKTTATPPSEGEPIPSAYQQQLTDYQQAIAPHYPHHDIRTAILWTHNLKLDYLCDHIDFRHEDTYV